MEKQIDRHMMVKKYFLNSFKVGKDTVLFVFGRYYFLPIKRASANFFTLLAVIGNRYGTGSETTVSRQANFKTYKNSDTERIQMHKIIS